jgi:hypothetical protein
VADGWCWFVLREKYSWLVAGGWFVLIEKYCWLVADKPSEQGAGRWYRTGTSFHIIYVEVFVDPPLDTFTCQHIRNPRSCGSLNLELAEIQILNGPV